MKKSTVKGELYHSLFFPIYFHRQHNQIQQPVAKTNAALGGIEDPLSLRTMVQKCYSANLGNSQPPVPQFPCIQKKA